MHRARIAGPMLAVVFAWVGVACSVDVGGGEPSAPSSTVDAGAPSATTTPGDAAAPAPTDARAPDAKKPIPSSPYFTIAVNGTPLVVKSVVSEVTNVYPEQGTSYYEVTATLARTPAIVAGLEDDPEVTIRVGKSDEGADACQEVRGAPQGAVTPVVRVRDIQFRYRRFTGSASVTAFPSTKRSGACAMTLESPSTDGHAWGEAKGSVQNDPSEPKLDFDMKWFQPVEWK